MDISDFSDLKKHHIAVLMGGPGAEREVSLASGKAVAQALQQGGLSVVECDIKDEAFDLPAGVTFAMNMIHGTFGEDGTLQALLEKRGIPYSGAGVVASRLAIDKVESKKRFVAAGVPTATFEVLQKGERPTLSLPFVIKPPREGSALGVHIMKADSDQRAIDAALKDVFSYDNEALVEEFFPGKELTVGILGEEVLPIIEIVAKDGLYNYENKYTVGGSRHLIPAPLDPVTTKQVQQAALAAHRALGVEVYSRIDVILHDDGRIAVLEVNTIPGMTETSLLPDAAAVFGLDFPALCVRIMELSLAKKPIA
ncbi:MAG: D-alanine--D-alanine ligase [Chthoniobacterales bacterium]|nr:D-alanine--D-alanine ligase [Chthoniobacterales bacterium]